MKNTKHILKQKNFQHRPIFDEASEPTLWSHKLNGYDVTEPRHRLGTKSIQVSWIKDQFYKQLTLLLGNKSWKLLSYFHHCFRRRVSLYLFFDTFLDTDLTWHCHTTVKLVGVDTPLPFNDQSLVLFQSSSVNKRSGFALAQWSQRAHFPVQFHHRTHQWDIWRRKDGGELPVRWEFRVLLGTSESNQTKFTKFDHFGSGKKQGNSVILQCLGTRIITLPSFTLVIRASMDCLVTMRIPWSEFYHNFRWFDGISQCVKECQLFFARLDFRQKKKCQLQEVAVRLSLLATLQGQIRRRICWRIQKSTTDSERTREFTNEGRD